MTVPLTSGAFDMDVAHPLRAARISHGDARGRAFAIGVTVALHIAVAVGLIAGVHVVSIVMPPALMVQINLPRPKVEKDLAPPPVLQKPMMVTAPPPEIAVQPAPSPITVQLAAPAPAPAPPPAAVAPQSVAGEGHDAFLGRLLGQLNRFKQYPRAARQAHIEGVVMLHFVMDANGTVRSADIAKSSGRPVLDAEALALIRRAQPLPALPADFPTRTLDAVVPIEFSLGG